jgi:glycosyltransferase involved in cell wall biosynthesis
MKRSDGGKEKESASLVVAPLPFPPPVTGQTLINASVAARLTQRPARVKLINTSPKSHRRTVLYHLRRMAAVMATLFVLAANSRHERRCLYTVVDAGHGMPYNFLVVSVARLFGYKVFLHHHAASYSKVRDARFASLCAVAGRGATHIALSEGMAQDLKALYRFCRQTIIAHNASHIPDPGKHKVSRRERELTIGFLSNLSSEKGLDTVLQTYEAIRADGLNARLVIAGPIVDDFAQGLIDSSRKKFGDAIVNLGPVSGASKRGFFEGIDVFLFPSRYRYEAQPLVVLEALSYGVPALVTRQGYAEEIVESLGTATGAPTFVAFAVSFADAWIKDPLFAAAQQSAARTRFLELADISRRQMLQLLSLLTGEEPAIH